MSGLSAFQIDVARVFFALPASEGFLLAGGSALLASGLTSRPTKDLDFFGEKGRVNVGAVCEQFLKEVEVRGWKCEVLQSDVFFVRLHVKGTDEVLVDIAIDVAAQYPSQLSILGPTFNHEELAGRKLLALYDRASVGEHVSVMRHPFGQGCEFVWRRRGIMSYGDSTKAHQSRTWTHEMSGRPGFG